MSLIYNIKEDNGNIWCLLLLKNGNLCSGSSDSKIKIYSLINFQCEKILLGHNSYITSLYELNNEKNKIKLDKQKIIDDIKINIKKDNNKFEEDKLDLKNEFEEKKAKILNDAERRNLINEIEATKKMRDIDLKRQEQEQMLEMFMRQMMCNNQLNQQLMNNNQYNSQMMYNPQYNQQIIPNNQFIQQNK